MHAAALTLLVVGVAEALIAEEVPREGEGLDQPRMAFGTLARIKARMTPQCLQMAVAGMRFPRLMGLLGDGISRVMQIQLLLNRPGNMLPHLTQLLRPPLQQRLQNH